MAVRKTIILTQSDVARGWRDAHRDGGVVIDVASDALVAEGLSMPHSPRLHGGKLWLLNSGRGEFDYADAATGRFEAVAFCPGYARGLTLVDNHAIVGLSTTRLPDTVPSCAAALPHST